MAEIPLDSGLVDNASAKKSQYIASRALLYYGQWLAGPGSEYQQYLQIGPLGPKPIIIKQALPRQSAHGSLGIGAMAEIPPDSGLVDNSSAKKMPIHCIPGTTLLWSMVSRPRF